MDKKELQKKVKAIRLKMKFDHNGIAFVGPVIIIIIIFCFVLCMRCHHNAHRGRVTKVQSLEYKVMSMGCMLGNFYPNFCLMFTSLDMYFNSLYIISNSNWSITLKILVLMGKGEKVV